MGKDPTTVAHAITLIRSASLSDIAEYAYAATARADSRLIFLAGACPLNDDGSTAAIGDYAGQALNAVENIQAALAASGAYSRTSSAPGFSSHRPSGRIWWLPGR